MTIEEKFATIKADIVASCKKVGRDPDRVHLVAVTKYVSIETAREALDCGVDHIGENRVDSAVEKMEALGDRGSWHFIGSLQSRKVKGVVGRFHYLHSLDRMSLAKELHKRMPEGETMNCFVQVNVSGEESKSGLAPRDVQAFIKEVRSYPAVRVIGLMTMAPFVNDPEETRPSFRKLRELRDEIAAQQLEHAPCTELSMGMSNDYRIALEEGATFIRVGSALVGGE
ncbi:YggS family pyridoxal phosphate-dependent enzyme [Shouchella shacheensis]|uniref:YggS family pyridoxal phosphate-dependent enzyme n=1 Tax=Shouchella shacheensis TaxID=1649580 RepID=UPI0007404806|nr:YggS family pyridoxal phosphate-dependent enzyme [Shouchella shacheensis]